MHYVYFLFNGFMTMCNVEKAFDTRRIYRTPAKAMFMNDRKQTAQHLKLQERLLTIN